MKMKYNYITDLEMRLENLERNGGSESEIAEVESLLDAAEESERIREHELAKK